MDSWQSERKILWTIVQEMVARGLVHGSNGNASLRLPKDERGDLIMITPSQIPYHQLIPDDLSVIDIDGSPVSERHSPSSETSIHLRVYEERPDVNSVIHTHSTFASVAAVTGLEIPPIVDETIISIGGTVKVATYGFPATEELAENVIQALGQRNAVLLRNHGLLGVGQSAYHALDICDLVERTAQIFTYAQPLGQVNHLPDKAITIEKELFKMRKASNLADGGHLGNYT